MSSLHARQPPAGRWGRDCGCFGRARACVRLRSSAPHDSALQDLFAGEAALAAAVGLNSADETLPYSTAELNAPEYSTDDFRMFSFKVRGWGAAAGCLSGGGGGVACLALRVHARCPRRAAVAETPRGAWLQVARCSKRYVHDWRACPFAHPTENARRRDPRLHKYLPVPCPEYKRGICFRCGLARQPSCVVWWGFRGASHGGRLRSAGLLWQPACLLQQPWRPLSLYP